MKRYDAAACQCTVSLGEPGYTAFQVLFGSVFIFAWVHLQLIVIWSFSNNVTRLTYTVCRLMIIPAQQISQCVVLDGDLYAWMGVSMHSIFAPAQSE